MTADSPLPLNLPEALAGLVPACDAYEAALMANDLDALDHFFRDAPDTLRFGIAENLYGIAAIRAYRQGRTGGSPPRDVLRREITTYGPDFGTCNLEFIRPATGTRGRQSQTWLRTAAGWKIVAAHVSLLAADR